MATSVQEKRRALIAYHAAGARLGRADDFAVLVRLCTPGMLGHARRLCDDPDTARDIVQEAWIALARALPDLRDERAFLAFALKIVTRSAARDLGRKRRGRDAETGFADTQSVAAPTPDDAVTNRELRAAIATLPPAQRATLALFYLEGLSVAEVAQALDIPPGTVKTRLMHARTRLRVLLKGDDNG